MLTHLKVTWRFVMLFSLNKKDLIMTYHRCNKGGVAGFYLRSAAMKGRYSRALTSVVAARTRLSSSV